MTPPFGGLGSSLAREMLARHGGKMDRSRAQKLVDALLERNRDWMDTVNRALGAQASITGPIVDGIRRALMRALTGEISPDEVDAEIEGRTLQ